MEMEAEAKQAPTWGNQVWKQLRCVSLLLLFYFYFYFLNWVGLVVDLCISRKPDVIGISASFERFV